MLEARPFDSRQCQQPCWVQPWRMPGATLGSDTMAEDAGSYASLGSSHKETWQLCQVWPWQQSPAAAPCLVTVVVEPDSCSRSGHCGSRAKQPLWAQSSSQKPLLLWLGSQGVTLLEGNGISALQVSQNPPPHLWILINIMVGLRMDAFVLLDTLPIKFCSSPRDVQK